METIIQIIGWVGTICIVAAYALVSSKKLDSTSRGYQVLNLVGAIAVGVSVYHGRVWSAVALQSIWGVIALYSLYRIQRNSH